MKKIFAILLAVTLLASMATVVSAAESTTTLTTTVPAATYTLNIPANQEIAFGATKTNIGNITVADANGFAEGKDLKVALSYSPFTSAEVSTTIPYEIFPSLGLSASDSARVPCIASGEKITFKGNANGTVAEQASISFGNANLDLQALLVVVNSADWGKALGGEYTATITFTAEVVVEQ